MKNIFRLIFVSALAFAFVACDTEEGTGAGELAKLTITVDKTIVQANSDDYVLVTVTGKDGVITDGLVYIDKKTNKSLAIVDGKFRPEKAGEYVFMASDGISSFSDYVTVLAIDYPVPAVPEDDEADKHAFNKKAMIVQFTSTGCVGCPGMKTVLKDLSVDESYSYKYVLASSHHDMDGVDDPATYHGNDMFASKLMNNNVSYPTLILDYMYTYQDYTKPEILKSTIDKLYGNGLSAAGIAVNSQGSSVAVVARVLVKVGAEADGQWRVGAFLLQDGIIANQKNAPDDSIEWKTHNNCIRAMDCNPNAVYCGHSLGRMPVGGTKDYTFVFSDLESNVVVDDCKLMIFVTCNNVVQNACIVPIGENVDFDYASVN